jgi:uncharacterized protein (TIGR02284 family)
MDDENVEVRERSVGVLNNLIEINYDGRESYRTAAEAIDNEDYQALFEEYAEQRAHFIGELNALVSRFGSEPADEGNLSGLFHRVWIDIKAAVTAGDAGAVMAECDRGEEAALRAYQEAMAADLPEKVKEVIRRQMSAVRLAHERVHALSTALHQ